MQQTLVALDDSARAPDVLRAASHVAKAYGGELTLLRVLYVEPEIPPAAPTAPDSLRNVLREQAMRDLYRLAASQQVGQSSGRWSRTVNRGG